MPSKGLSFGWKQPKSLHLGSSNLPKRPGHTHFSPHAFQCLHDAVRHTNHATAGRPVRRPQAPGSGWSLMLEGVYYLRPRGEVWEEVMRMGYVRQGRLGPPLPVQTWGHSATSWPWLAGQWGARVSYYPLLSKPFLLATCHLQRGASGPPHPSSAH